MSEQFIAHDRMPKAVGGAEDIDLLELLIALAKNKKRIIATTLSVAILAVAVTLLMPNIYTATTRVLPPQQSQSAATAMLGQLGALGGLAGSSLGIKNPSDLYIGLLGSRTVSDSMIKRFRLQEVYQTKLLSDTRSVLSGVSSFTADKDGTINIAVDDKDPKRAAALANAYVEELQKLMESLAVTDASQRRLFYEKQLRKAKDNLSDAEVALKRVQESTGLIQLNGQAEALIKAAADLKAQIAAKEVKLGEMRVFATTTNPDYVRAQKELAGLRAQLAKLDTGMNEATEGKAFSAGRVPEVGLEYVRKVRDVKYNEAIYELLSKQYEAARIDEAREGSVIQVVDRAILPDKKSKPKRTLIVLLATIAGAFISVCWVFLKEAVSRLKEEGDPEQQAQLHRLRTYLRWRKG